MEIKSAEFIISNTDISKCPQHNRPEYAFIGRSNVGKSSLINMLTNRKGLAMTSATPGKTLLINHFLINKDWYLVDLPGYGYAKRGHKQQEELKRIINSYILERPQLTSLFVLIDSRLEPQVPGQTVEKWPPVLSDDDGTVRTQDAPPFAQRVRGIGEMVECMVAGDDIEGRVIEGKARRIGLQQRGSPLEALRCDLEHAG